MKNKGFFISIGILFSFFGCSQNVKETYKIQPTMNIIQNPHINASNIVEELIKEVKHYPKEPMYIISYGIQYCFAEVWVNDIPVYKEFKDIGGRSAFDINQAVLKNGTQKVTFRLYSIKKIEGDPEVYNILIKETDVEFQTSFYNHNENNPQEIIVKEYRTPRIPNPDKRFTDSIFAFAGKDYYEGSFTFEAQVPYTLQNLDKAKDLRKMNKEEVEAKLLKKYQEVWSIYQNKDYDNIARISYDNLKNQFVSKYNDEKYIREVWAMLMEAYQLKNFQMQPIENYELKFFADDKLAALMSKSKEHWLRGNSAMWAEFDRGDGEETLTFNDYFYILEGENDFRVY